LLLICLCTSIIPLLLILLYRRKPNGAYKKIILCIPVNHVKCHHNRLKYGVARTQPVNNNIYIILFCLALFVFCLVFFDFSICAKYASRKTYVTCSKRFILTFYGNIFCIILWARRMYVNYYWKPSISYSSSGITIIIHSYRRECIHEYFDFQSEKQRIL